MHKCIMVKVGGNEKHIKYVKTCKFYEIRGKFAKVGGNDNFPKIEGKCTETAKIGGEIQTF